MLDVSLTGHETVGEVAAMGSKVKDFKIGDRVVADNSELCGTCFYCRRGQCVIIISLLATVILGN